MTHQIKYGKPLAAT